MGPMRKRNVKDVEMGCRYDDEDVDRPVIHFDRDNPTIDEGTVFDNVETADMQLKPMQSELGSNLSLKRATKRDLGCTVGKVMCVNGDYMHVQCSVDTHFRLQ